VARGRFTDPNINLSVTFGEGALRKNCRDRVICTTSSCSRLGRSIEDARNASANWEARRTGELRVSVSTSSARRCNCPAISKASCHGSPSRHFVVLELDSFPGLVPARCRLLGTLGIEKQATPSALANEGGNNCLQLCPVLCPVAACFALYGQTSHLRISLNLRGRISWNKER
jgi:hypothetical protein